MIWIRDMVVDGFWVLAINYCGGAEKVSVCPRNDGSKDEGVANGKCETLRDGETSVLLYEPETLTF